MDVFCLIERTGPLKEPTQPIPLPQPLAWNNAQAHAFRFHVTNDDGTAADMTGIGVTGNFTADGHDTISPLSGTITGNMAQIILPAACYAYPGRYTFEMNLIKSGQTRTVLWVEGRVSKKQTDDIVDPGTPVTNIETAIGNANAAATSATNAATSATNAASAANAAAASIADYLGPKHDMASTDDVDTTYAAGMYAVKTASLPAHWPLSTGGCMIVYNPKATLSQSATGYIVQEIVTDTYRLYRYKTVNEWTDWSHIVTPASIADYLGPRQDMASTDDIDTTYAAGMYAVKTASLPAHWPLSNGGCMIVYNPKATLSQGTTGYIVQEIITDTNRLYRYKTVNGWTDWAYIDTVAGQNAKYIRYDTAQSLSSSAKIQALANIGAIGQQSILQAADSLDLVTTPGIYAISAVTPPQYSPISNTPCTLIVTSIGSNITQILCDRNGAVMTRMLYGQSWGTWNVFSNGAISLKYALIPYESGAINSNTGDNSASGTRVRTPGKWSVPAGAYYISLKTGGYKMYVFRYAADNTYIASSGWLYPHQQYRVSGGEKLRFVLAYPDNADIAAADVNGTPPDIVYSGSAETVDGVPTLWLRGSTAGMSKDNAVPMDFVFADKTGACSVKWQGSSSTRYVKKNYTVSISSESDGIDALCGWTKWINDYLGGIGVVDSGKKTIYDTVSGTQKIPDRNTVSTWGLQKKFCLKANFIDVSASRNVVCARLWGQVRSSNILGVTAQNISGGNAATTIPIGGKTVTVHPGDRAYYNGTLYGVQWGYSVYSQTDKYIWVVDPLMANLSSVPNWGAIDGCPITVNINGKYAGLYTLNIPKAKWMFGSGIVYVVSGEDNNSAACQWKATAAVATDDDYSVEVKPDSAEDSTVRTALNTAISAVLEAAEALEANPDAWHTWEKQINDAIAIDSIIDYFIFACCIGGHDIMARNILYGTYDGTQWFMSAYDLDTTFGSDPYGTNWFPAGRENDRNTFASAAAMHALCNLVWQYAASRFVERYHALRAGVLSDANVLRVISNFVSDIPERAYNRDRERWPEQTGTSMSTLANHMAWYTAHAAYLDQEIAEKEASL